MNNFKNIFILLLPFLSITTTGLFFPINKKQYMPVFQPSGWVFSTVWTYITFVLGYTTMRLYTKNIGMSNRNSLSIVYILLVSLLNLWLVINNKKNYGLSFAILLMSLYVSIVYLILMTSIINKNSLNEMRLVYLLFPMCIWLGIASCLNGVIYDYYS